MCRYHWFHLAKLSPMSLGCIHIWNSKWKREYWVVCSLSWSLNISLSLLYLSVCVHITFVELKHTFSNFCMICKSQWVQRFTEILNDDKNYKVFDLVFLFSHAAVFEHVCKVKTYSVFTWVRCWGKSKCLYDLYVIMMAK